jgi:hypothetical protein
MTRKRLAFVILLSISVPVLLYAAGYLVLTLCGGYHFSQSGEPRYVSGMSVSDIIEWDPKGLWWQGRYRFAGGEYGSRGNFAGYVYSPLIALDRALWHRTQGLFDEFSRRGEKDFADAGR